MEAICISGGGCKAVSLLGLLYEYHNRDLLNIQTWSTCSVGGFIAVLLLCGVNPLQMLNYYPQIENVSPSIDLLSLLVTKSGIMRIQKYTKKFCDTVEKFVGIKNPTLLQFYEKTGKTIYIEAVNITTEEVVYFNHKDHPNVSLFSAIWASAAIPGIFIPIKIDGESYIDGGMYCTVPLAPIMGLKTIAFTFVSDKDFLSFLKIPSTIVKKEAIKNHKQLTIVECKYNFSLLDFKKSSSELLDEFTFGREQYNFSL